MSIGKRTVPAVVKISWHARGIHDAAGNIPALCTVADRPDAPRDLVFLSREAPCRYAHSSGPLSHDVPPHFSSRKPPWPSPSNFFPPSFFPLPR